MVLELVQKGKLAIIDEYLCKFRLLKGSMTTSNRYRIDVPKDKIALYKYARQILPLSSWARRQNRRIIASNEIQYGIALLRGNILMALKMILYGVIRDPTVLLINSKVFKIIGKRWNHLHNSVPMGDG